jgi:hypothetical protein
MCPREFAVILGEALADARRVERPAGPGDCVGDFCEAICRGVATWLVVQGEPTTPDVFYEVVASTYANRLYRRPEGTASGQ